MTPEQFYKVISVLRSRFEEMGVEKITYPHDEILDTVEHGLAHCHGMLDKMETFIEEGRMDKVNRWLGFIQGVLWSNGIYTLTDLMHQNKKSE